MKRILTILLVCLSFALFSQTIYNPAQIGQTGRNQCTSRGFWVKSDTTLLTSQLWIPNGSGSGLVLTSDANGFATWQAAGSGSCWSLTGNAGTNPATNFIGTTDSVDVIVSRNGIGYDKSNLKLSNCTAILSSGCGDSIVVGGESADIKIFEALGGKIEMIGGAIAIRCASNVSKNIILQKSGSSTNVIIEDTITVNGNLKINNGTQGAGKVLTSDSNGLASWQGGIIYDSLTSLTGDTITLTNNSTYIIAASGTITDVTWSFPTGNTGDVLDIENMNVIVTLNITGVGTGTITAAKITNTKTAGLKTFHNYGGNWY